MDNRLMRALIGGAIAVLAACGIALATQPAPPAPEQGPQLSGTIRLQSGQFATVSDAAHTPQGFGEIETLPDRIRVDYDFEHCGIESVQVTPDESFASASLRVGASVGTTYLDIFSYTPSSGATAVSPALLSRPGGNIWITGHFTPCDESP